MPITRIHGINLSFDEYDAGRPVVLLAGTGAPGRVWKTYQVPALIRAGFRVVTVDNRGVPPTDRCEEGLRGGAGALRTWPARSPSISRTGGTWRSRTAGTTASWKSRRR
jgi:pimeloyl-ACP methyl ester carboxylesterase